MPAVAVALPGRSALLVEDAVSSAARSPVREQESQLRPLLSPPAGHLKAPAVAVATSGRSALLEDSRAPHERKSAAVLLDLALGTPHALLDRRPGCCKGRVTAPSRTISIVPRRSDSTARALVAAIPDPIFRIGTDGYRGFKVDSSATS
jgi:hypothetical protein